jgi:hypothetical protein
VKKSLGYELNDPGIESRQAQIFSLFEIAQTASGAHPPPY